MVIVEARLLHGDGFRPSPSTGESTPVELSIITSSREPPRGACTERQAPGPELRTHADGFGTEGWPPQRSTTARRAGLGIPAARAGTECGPPKSRTGTEKGDPALSEHSLGRRSSLRWPALEAVRCGLTASGRLALVPYYRRCQCLPDSPGAQVRDLSTPHAY